MPNEQAECATRQVLYEKGTKLIVFASDGVYVTRPGAKVHRFPALNVDCNAWLVTVHHCTHCKRVRQHSRCNSIRVWQGAAPREPSTQRISVCYDDWHCCAAITVPPPPSFLMCDQIHYCHLHDALCARAVYDVLQVMYERNHLRTTHQCLFRACAGPVRVAAVPSCGAGGCSNIVWPATNNRQYLGSTANPRGDKGAQRASAGGMRQALRGTGRLCPREEQLVSLTI